MTASTAINLRARALRENQTFDLIAQRLEHIARNIGRDGMYSEEIGLRMVSDIENELTDIREAVERVQVKYRGCRYGYNKGEIVRVPS